MLRHFGKKPAVFSFMFFAFFSICLSLCFSSISNAGSLFGFFKHKKSFASKETVLVGGYIVFVPKEKQHYLEKIRNAFSNGTANIKDVIEDADNFIRKFPYARVSFFKDFYRYKNEIESFAETSLGKMSENQMILDGESAIVGFYLIDVINGKNVSNVDDSNLSEKELLDNIAAGKDRRDSLNKDEFKNHFDSDVSVEKENSKKAVSSNDFFDNTSLKKG